MRSICDKLGAQPTTLIKPTEIPQTVTALAAAAKLASLADDQALFLRTICQLLHRGGLDYQIQVNVLRLLHGMPISDPTIIQEILSLIGTGEVVTDVDSPLGQAAAKRLRDLGALGVLLTNCHPMDLGPVFLSSTLEIASTVAYYHPGTALWDALTAVFARGGFPKPFAAELMERRLEASFAYHAYVMLRHLPLQVMMTHVATLLGDLIPWQEETLLSKGSLKLLLSFNDPHVALSVFDALIGQVDGVGGRRKKAQTGGNVVACTLTALLSTPAFPPEVLIQRFPAINHLLAAEGTDQVLREAVIGVIKVKVPMRPHYLHLVEGITITMNKKERVCERLEIANFLMRIPWVPARFSEEEDEWFGGKKGHSAQGAVETLMGKWVDDRFPAIREKVRNGEGRVVCIEAEG